ncbi:MAG: UbiH/UbiF/VisC/COQ6 family ubiquinone biosynthesis hydroxylase [Gammaproteobacteria bacterium]|nr:UbiH/UbiF/VisC/COQ6 family ubiquinone biosynthesis hydroxylase [Gammaproteobacteria bacterium]
MSTKESNLDILVAGGGIVGATTACALALQGLRVGLIEPHPPSDSFDPVYFDHRVSAITRASEQIFRALGAWDKMCARRVTPFREMHVWDDAGCGAIHFDSADLGEDSLGHIVENRVMQIALLETLRALPHVEIYSPAAPTRLRIDDAAAQLDLDNGRTLHAALIIGSDGHASWVREQCGITQRASPYEQSALIANVETSLPHRDTAWQCFTAEGPVALLPLANGHSSLVWSVPHARCAALLQLDDTRFLHELNLAFGDSLGLIHAVGARATHPLQRAHANDYISSRVALVGDAAHTVHPMAGQGVNLGLLDAATLAEVVLDAHRAGRDLGDLLVLRRYERWRKGHNLAMQTAIDGLKLLFAKRNPAILWARNIGVRFTDENTALKNFIAQHAIGRRGDLPALARAP